RFRLRERRTPLLDVSIGRSSRHPILGANLVNQRLHSRRLRGDGLHELLDVPFGRNARLLSAGAKRQHRKRQESKPTLHPLLNVTLVGSEPSIRAVERSRSRPYPLCLLSAPQQEKSH